MLDQTLQITYAMEYVILIEYVEVFVPFVYASYVVGTYYSPLREYFNGFEHITSVAKLHKSISGILLYGSLELLSLALVYVLIRRRFQSNILYNLAFVLESHFFAIQGKLVFFLVFILNFNLQHFGMVTPDLCTYLMAGSV